MFRATAKILRIAIPLVLLGLEQRINDRSIDLGICVVDSLLRGFFFTASLFCSRIDQVVNSCRVGNLCGLF
jgi:hypothetical protein